MWRFFPESNQYTVDPGPNTHSPLVSNYGSLDKVGGTTTITGSERLGNFNCTVVRVERPDSVRTLWIDSKSNFVIKAIPRSHHLRLPMWRQAASSSVGTRAPDFALSDLQIKPVRLSELKGEVVLMDFWATWCLPCRAELPKIELLHREFKDKGLIVLGVDDEEPKDQAAFLSKFAYTFRSLVDSSEQVMNLYKTAGIPTTVLDRSGRHDPGFRPWQLLVRHIKRRDPQGRPLLRAFEDFDRS